MLHGMDEVIQLFWVILAFPVLNRIIPWLEPIMGKVNPNVKSALDFRALLAAQVDKLLQDPGILDRAEHEIVYHHLMTPQPGKGAFVMPSRKSLVEEVHRKTLLPAYH